MTDHEKAAIEAVYREVERLNLVRHTDIIYEAWEAARGYVPPATEPASKPSWADVKPGDRVTFHNLSNPFQGPSVTALQTSAADPRNVVLGDREMPIIRIERPEYRDVTPRATRPRDE